MNACENGTLVDLHTEERTKLGKSSQCHFVHHKYHMEWNGIGFGAPQRAATNRVTNRLTNIVQTKVIFNQVTCVACFGYQTISKF